VLSWKRSQKATRSKRLRDARNSKVPSPRHGERGQVCSQDGVTLIIRKRRKGGVSSRAVTSATKKNSSQIAVENCSRDPRHHGRRYERSRVEQRKERRPVSREKRTKTRVGEVGQTAKRGKSRMIRRPTQLPEKRATAQRKRQTKCVKGQTQEAHGGVRSCFW